MSRASKPNRFCFLHLLWNILVSPRNITIAIGLLIFHQLRHSKVKSMLPSIPDKADIIENVDSTSSHLGSFPFHEFLVLCPLFTDPITKPKRYIPKIVVINMTRAGKVMQTFLTYSGLTSYFAFMLQSLLASSLDNRISEVYL